MTAKIDVVTVCFADELKMLQMQARSIKRHMEKNFLGSYRIIINDPAHSQECRQFIDQVVVPELGWVAPHVSVTLADTIDPTLRGSGWLTQQVLKLAAARLVSTPHYLVLDAKNHFISQVDATTLFRGDQPRARTAAPTRNQRKWLDASLAYFELDRKHGTEKVGVTITPYLMITGVCLALLDEVSRRGDHLSQLFSRPIPRPSEFFFYYAYIEALHGGYHHLYRCDMFPQATIFTKHPETDAAFDTIMERTSRPDCWTFAVHRNRLARLSPSQTERVLAVWRGADLIGDGEEEWFTTLYLPGETYRIPPSPPASPLQRIRSVWNRWVGMRNTL